MCHKQWDVHENSPIWREVRAKEIIALNCVPPLIKSSYIKWFSDSYKQATKSFRWEVS